MDWTEVAVAALGSVGIAGFIKTLVTGWQERKRAKAHRDLSDVFTPYVVERAIESRYRWRDYAYTVREIMKRKGVEPPPVPHDDFTEVLAARDPFYSGGHTERKTDGD